jgi:ABC-type multidrug transport system ATPase subunit
MLVIRDLVKVYPGPVTALQGIQLDVHSGMFGLLGPNGAGKSTLMRILAGLLEPTSGTVTLDDEDILAVPERVWSKLGYLPQDFGFYPHLTGEAMLEHLLRLKGIEGHGGLKPLVADLLARVDLTSAAKRKVKTYSGGMRQRLGIAQALAGNPRLIIVDEPTAGLDPEQRVRFYDLLAELSEGRIVILSTHIVEDVAVLCPRFAVIRSGKLIAETTPSEARAAIEGTIWDGSVEKSALEEFKRTYRVTQAMLVEGRHRVRIYIPGLGALGSPTSGSGASGVTPPVGFTLVKPTLEDAYLVLMRSERNTAVGSRLALAGTGS